MGYESPSIKTLVVRVGGVLCGSDPNVDANGVQRSTVVSGFDAWDE